MDDEEVNQLIVERFYKITKRNVSWKKNRKRNSYLKINIWNGRFINKKTENWANDQSRYSIQ